MASRSATRWYSTAAAYQCRRTAPTTWTAVSEGAVPPLAPLGSWRPSRAPVLVPELRASSATESRLRSAFVLGMERGGKPRFDAVAASHAGRSPSSGSVRSACRSTSVAIWTASRTATSAAELALSGRNRSTGRPMSPGAGRTSDCFCDSCMHWSIGTADGEPDRRSRPARPPAPASGYRPHALAGGDLLARSFPALADRVQPDIESPVEPGSRQVLRPDAWPS